MCSPSEEACACDAHRSSGRLLALVSVPRSLFALLLFLLLAQRGEEHELGALRDEVLGPAMPDRGEMNSERERANSVEKILKV